MAVDLQAELANLVQQGAAQGAVTPQAPSAPVQPELKDYIQRSYNGDDGSQVTVYSTTGKRQSPDMFDKAVEHYASTGKDLKGFTVLTPGVSDTLRSAYEAVNQPLQQAIPGVLGTGAAHAVAPIGGLLQQLGILSPEQAQGLEQHARDAGSKVGQFAASTFDTPEKAGSAAGILGAGIATGGMSFPLQMAGAAIGGAAGYIGGGAVTGHTPPLEEAVVAGALAAGAQGFSNLLRYSLGMSTSQAAQQQVARKLMDYTKGVYGAGANANTLEMLGSNPGSVAKLTNIGLDAITGDLKAATAQLKPDIMQGLPRTLTTGAQNTLRAQLRDAEEVITAYLQDVGKPGAERYMRDSFNDVVARVRQVVVDDLKAMPKPSLQKAVNQVDQAMLNYAQQAQQLKPGATLLQALKESSAEGGFNVQAFQRTLQGYQQAPGTFMDEVGNIARRGAPFGTTDTSKSLGVDVKRYLGVPSSIGRFIPNPKVPLGTSYAGNIEGRVGRTALDTLGTVSGMTAIRDFLGRRPTK